MAAGPPEPEPPNGFFVEGLVLDAATFAPVADADVVVATERPGYVLAARTGANGRFELTVSNVVRRSSALEQVVEAILWPGDPTPAELTYHYTLGARAAGGRCLPPRRYPMEDRRLVLYLEPCRSPRS
jgi:hypothetical protein